MSWLIDLARVCVPCPTGFTLYDRTYGISAMGYDKLMYNAFKAIGNADDVAMYGDFYDVVSVAYDVKLDKVPSVRPYVRWVDYCKKKGGVLMHCAPQQRNELLVKYNTLICDNEAEQEFLHHMQSNLSRRQIGNFEFDFEKNVPERFAKISDTRIQTKIQNMAFPNKQR
ncbi:MAG: hypothetical protein IKW09_01420 [Alphaproteobacteria bacterium]|nr:hypothetical protein [Alphaproteobacteria bacterium]